MCVVVVAVSLVPVTARRFRTQGGHCRHHMRANSQVKCAGASRYVPASDVRRKIQRRASFSARTVVKSPGLGADAIGTEFAPEEGTADTICAQIAR